MSIQSEINRLDQNIQDSLSAVASKGVEVPESANSNDLPGLINEIPTNSNFIVTCTVDVANSTLTNVSHSLEEIQAAFQRNEHIVINGDLSQMMPNAMAVLPLILLTEAEAAFASIVYMYGCATSITAGIRPSSGNYLVMIPLQEQIAVVSSEDAVEEGKITIVV